MKYYRPKERTDGLDLGIQNAVADAWNTNARMIYDRGYEDGLNDAKHNNVMAFTSAASDRQSGDWSAIRKKMLHELKILPKYFYDIIWNKKRFELRKDDRDFQVGDVIRLREWDGEKYTGTESCEVMITYILRNCSEYGLMEGYCVIGFEQLKENHNP